MYGWMDRMDGWWMDGRLSQNLPLVWTSRILCLESEFAQFSPHAHASASTHALARAWLGEERPRTQPGCCKQGWTCGQYEGSAAVRVSQVRRQSLGMRRFGQHSAPVAGEEVLCRPSSKRQGCGSYNQNVKPKCLQSDQPSPSARGRSTADAGEWNAEAACVHALNLQMN